MSTTGIKAAQHPQVGLFEPLVSVLVEGRYLRVVARPGWVTADPAFAPCRPLPDTTWSAERHAEAFAACAESIDLGDGILAARGGDGVVVTRVPQAFLPADLVREQVISPLAMRLLSASLAAGRNILLTGAANAALPLLYALVGEGARPAMLATRAAAAPQRWMRLDSLTDARMAHADRVGVCGLSAALVAETMCALCAVVGYNPSRRLDQALMRYELGAAEMSEASRGPLHVLAGVDLVVQSAFAGSLQVAQICEIVLTEAGYRPLVLFTTGMPPVPQALIPCAPPSFLPELAAAGHGGLAEELDRLKPAASAPPPAAAEVSAGPVSPRATGRSARAPERMRQAPSARSRPAPKSAAKVVDASPPESLPGWELDRASAPALEPASAGATSPEDAVLAATYGLAPPPRPPGTRAVRGFDEVLARMHPAPASAASDDAEVEPTVPPMPPDDGDDSVGP